MSGTEAQYGTPLVVGSKLAKALLEAQRAIVSNGGMVKDANNPHYDNDFASRPGVLDAVLPALNLADVAVVQLPSTGPEGYLSFSTILIHESGEALERTAIVPLQKTDPQGYASAITYASRTALVVLLGLKTLDDDDGNQASGHSGSARPSKPAGGFPGQAKPATVKGGFPGKKPGVDFSKHTKAGKAAAVKAPERKKKGLFPSANTTEDQQENNEEEEGDVA